VVAPLAAGAAGAFMALSSALAITVGIIMLCLSFMKLGFISDFLCKSVMRVCLKIHERASRLVINRIDAM
jgi:MFS superfamily sulfate permease-like transporter